MALLEVKDLTYYYPAAEQPALQGINLCIAPGEFVLLLGGSGSGKSTLARALAGLVPDFYGGRVGGDVLFQGQSLRQMDKRQLARRVGIVFQEPENQLVMLSAEAELAFGLENLGLESGEVELHGSSLIPDSVSSAPLGGSAPPRRGGRPKLSA